MPLPNLELVVLDDVEGSLDTTRVSAELNLSFSEVTHDRDLSLNTTIATQGLEVGEKAMGVTRQTNPITIDEHLGHRLITEIFSRQLFKLLYSPILKLVDDIR